MILTNTSNSHLSNITLYYYYILFKLTSCSYFFFFFFLNDPATPEIYTLPLHDALPIWWGFPSGAVPPPRIMRHRLRRICRSPSLPPEERELPDVLAGRHHQRAQCEHAGLAYGALELRELSEPVARLGVDRPLVHAALAQQQYALGAQRELPVQSQAAQHVRQVLAAEARAQRLQVATAVAVEEPTGIDRLQQLHVAVEIRVEPVA